MTTSTKMWAETSPLIRGAHYPKGVGRDVLAAVHLFSPMGSRGRWCHVTKSIFDATPLPLLEVGHVTMLVTRRLGAQGRTVGPMRAVG